MDTETKPLSECPKLQVFLDVVHTNSTKITKKDITFFETENILEEISFENLWSKNISEKTRATIWKYFQTFSLLTINMKSSQALKDALSSIQNDEEVDLADRGVAKDLKKMFLVLLANIICQSVFFHLFRKSRLVLLFLL